MCIRDRFLDWSKRLNEAEKDNFAHASDMLPHKAIAHIPSNIDYAQKQIKDLLERVLDMDASKRSVSSRLYDYYKDPYHVDPRPFEFHPLTVSFEMIDRNAYAEVLYPKSIYDLIDYLSLIHIYAVSLLVDRGFISKVKTSRCVKSGKWLQVNNHYYILPLPDLPSAGHSA